MRKCRDAAFSDLSLSTCRKEFLDDVPELAAEGQHASGSLEMQELALKEMRVCSAL
jgi:hypothetical protein